MYFELDYAKFLINGPLLLSINAYIFVHFPHQVIDDYGSWIYNYLCNQCISSLCGGFESRSWQGVLDITLCDKVCQSMVFSRYFRYTIRISSSGNFYVLTKVWLHGQFLFQIRFKLSIWWSVHPFQTQNLVKTQTPFQYLNDDSSNTNGVRETLKFWSANNILTIFTFSTTEELDNSVMVWCAIVKITYNLCLRNASKKKWNRSIQQPSHTLILIYI
jgi:hypothetical protein